MKLKLFFSYFLEYTTNIDTDTHILFNHEIKSNIAGWSSWSEDGGEAGLRRASESWCSPASLAQREESEWERDSEEQLLNANQYVSADFPSV